MIHSRADNIWVTLFFLKMVVAYWSLSLLSATCQFLLQVTSPTLSHYLILKTLQDLDLLSGSTTWDLWRVHCSSEALEVSSRDPGWIWTFEPVKRLNSKQTQHYLVTSRTQSEAWDLPAKKHLHKTLQTRVERTNIYRLFPRYCAGTVVGT